MNLEGFTPYKKEDAEKEIAAYAPDSNLPTLYEQKVDKADHISDQIRLSSDQVVKRADLEARIADLKSRLETITAEIGRVQNDRAAYQEEWDAIWDQLGIKPGTPREMKQWLLKVDNLLSNVRSVHIISGEAQNMAANCKTLRETMAHQISKFDIRVIMSATKDLATISCSSPALSIKT